MEPLAAAEYKDITGNEVFPCRFVIKTYATLAHLTEKCVTLVQPQPTDFWKSSVQTTAVSKTVHT